MHKDNWDICDLMSPLPAHQLFILTGQKYRLHLAKQGQMKNWYNADDLEQRFFFFSHTHAA